MSRIKRTVRRSKEGMRAICLNVPWALYHRIVDEQKRLLKKGQGISQTALIRRAIARYLKEAEKEELSTSSS